MKEYVYRLVRPDKADYVFGSVHSSIGAACYEMCQAQGIPGTHRYANGYTVFMVHGVQITGIVVRD